MREPPEEGDLLVSADIELYDRYAPVIFAYARLHLFLYEDAEDLTIEVFTAALEHDNLSSFAESEKLAWLRRVAHNRLIDRYRYADRHPGMPLDKVVETVESDDVSAPEQIALRKEAYGQLRALIGQLPVLQQQVLQLRYEDGLRFAEIAVVLNKREDAVRKLLSRTLTTLRTLYLQQEGGRA